MKTSGLILGGNIINLLKLERDVVTNILMAACGFR